MREPRQLTTQHTIQTLNRKNTHGENYVQMSKTATLRHQRQRASEARWSNALKRSGSLDQGWHPRLEAQHLPDPTPKRDPTLSPWFERRRTVGHERYSPKSRRGAGLETRSSHRARPPWKWEHTTSATTATIWTFESSRKAIGRDPRALIQIE